jgi:hypothetical protein
VVDTESVALFHSVDVQEINATDLMLKKFLIFSGWNAGGNKKNHSAFFWSRVVEKHPHNC